MYFKNFPRVNYLYYDKDQNIVSKVAVNITARMKILNYVRTYRTNFDRYLIKDGERPDTLSHRLYERPDLHWIFFLVNDMFNPYESWPMSQRDLEEYVKEKYSGSSFFAPDIWKPRVVDEIPNSTDDEIGSLTKYEYKILDGFDVADLTLTQINNGFQGITIPTSDLKKITVGSTVKVVVNGSLFTTTILEVNSEFFEIALETKSWNSSLSSSSQHYLVYQIDNFGEKRCIRVPITRLVNERRYSVHEFRHQGEYRDPSQVFLKGSVPYSTSLTDTNPYNFFIHPFGGEAINAGNFANPSQKESLKSFAEVYAMKDSDGNYLNSSYYLTNEEYELEENEKKRKIFVPRPSMVNQVVQAMKEIFSNISGKSRA